MNRNLLILGALALLILGGLGIFLASRGGGNTSNTTENIKNRIVNNEFFTEIVASGATTKKDLEAVTDIQPYGDGFIGISNEPLTWAKAQDVARRAGAKILGVETGATEAGKKLLAAGKLICLTPLLDGLGRAAR